VAAVLAARLDRLPLGARQVLERAAVVGASGLVADLLPLCEGVDVQGELDFLASRDLLDADHDRWWFASELVRDAAVGTLARDERAELHQVRGLVLAARGMGAEAGFHLEQASRLLRSSEPERSAVLAEQAASRLAAAGLRALSGDLVAACDLLSRAVALLPADSPRRLNLLTELSRGLQLTGELGRAREVLEEAVQRCDDHGLREVGAHARLALVDLRRSTEPERAYAELPRLLADVLPALESARDDRGLSLAYQLEAAALQYRVRWAAMEQPLAKSLHHAGRSGDRRLVELAQSLQVGSMFHGPLPLDQARARLEEMLAQPSASPWHQASVSARLAGILALQGDPEAGRKAIAEVRQVFHDLGRELSSLATTFMSGPIEMLADNPEAAAAQLSEACDGLLAMGDKAFTSTLAALLAEAWWRCGNHEAAAEAVGLSRRLAGMGDVISQVRWRSVQAKLHAVRRNGHEAEALCSQAVQLVIGTDEVTSQGDVLADAAEVQLLLGNRSAAEVLLRDAVERYERKGAPQAVEVVLGRLT
jgi:predicted ATPase